jgi:hypothetical protein
MPEVIEAIYEGNGVVRLEREPEGVLPRERVSVYIVPAPVDASAIEKASVHGLQQQIQDFEARYSWKTPDFYSRFIHGEIGDNRDFIVWAGLYEILQRTKDRARPVNPGD